MVVLPDPGDGREQRSRLRGRRRLHLESSGDASNYFAGPGQHFSVGLDEGGAWSFDLGWNDYGGSGGLSVGLGASFPGIGVVSRDTYGMQVDPSAWFNSPDMSGDSAAPYFAP